MTKTRVLIQSQPNLIQNHQPWFDTCNTSKCNQGINKTIDKRKLCTAKHRDRITRSVKCDLPVVRTRGKEFIWSSFSNDVRNFFPTPFHIILYISVIFICKNMKALWKACYQFDFKICLRYICTFQYNEINKYI